MLPCKMILHKHTVSLSDNYFMYVDTQAAVEGTKTILASPPFQFQLDGKGFCLRYYMRAVSKYSITAKLQLYIVVQNHIYLPHRLITEIDLNGTMYSTWKSYDIYLPPLGIAVVLI